MVKSTLKPTQPTVWETGFVMICDVGKLFQRPGFPHHCLHDLLTDKHAREAPPYTFPTSLTPHWSLMTSGLKYLIVSLWPAKLTTSFFLWSSSLGIHGLHWKYAKRPFRETWVAGDSRPAPEWEVFSVLTLSPAPPFILRLMAQSETHSSIVNYSSTSFLPSSCRHSLLCISILHIRIYMFVCV